VYCAKFWETDYYSISRREITIITLRHLYSITADIEHRELEERRSSKSKFASLRATDCPSSRWFVSVVEGNNFQPALPTDCLIQKGILKTRHDPQGEDSYRNLRKEKTNYIDRRRCTFPRLEGGSEGEVTRHKFPAARCLYKRNRRIRVLVFRRKSKQLRLFRRWRVKSDGHLLFTDHYTLTRSMSRRKMTTALPRPDFLAEIRWCLVFSFDCSTFASREPTILAKDREMSRINEKIHRSNSNPLWSSVLRKKLPCY